jgi:hypothetical protein
MSMDRELRTLKSLANDHVRYIYQCLSSDWLMYERKADIESHIALSFGHTKERGKYCHRHTQTS